MNEAPGAQTREIFEGLLVGVDAKGTVVGFDSDHASRKLDLSKIEDDCAAAGTCGRVSKHRPARVPGLRCALSGLRSLCFTPATRYMVRFRQAVYVLHAIQKKSPKGIKTARTDIALIAGRLKIAQQDYEARYGKA